MPDPIPLTPQPAPRAVYAIEIGHAFTFYGVISLLADDTLVYAPAKRGYGQVLRNIVRNMRQPSADARAVALAEDEIDEQAADAATVRSLSTRLTSYLWARELPIPATARASARV